jgi:hypothetical protein
MLQAAANLDFAGNPLFLPLQSSSLDKIESAFLNSQGLPQYNVALGFGATSRLSGGQCMERHLTTGQCWGEFHQDNTRFVSRSDHNTSCALEENHLLGSMTSAGVPGNAVVTNQMNLFSSGQNAPEAQCSSQASYSSYGSCTNCSLSGAAVYQCNMTTPLSAWSQVKDSNC